MATIEEAISLALQYQQSGAFGQAEHLYRQILQVDPRNIDALHLLGVLASQQGNNPLAVHYLTQAEQLLPDHPVLHYNLGVALRAQGLTAEAVEHYRRAIQLQPDYVEAYNNLGDALRELGRLDEGQAALQAAVRLKPDYAEAHTSLGTLFRQRGQLEQARASYQEALRHRPGFATAHINLGVVLVECGRTDEALNCYRNAIRLDPSLAEAHNNLGNLFESRGQLEEAEACYREAIRLRPEFAIAHKNLGVALQAGGRPEEALASFETAVRLAPHFVDAVNSRGRSLQDLGNVHAALASYEHALKIQPDLAETHVHRGMALLLSGRLEEGWPEYEWRVRCKDYPPSAVRLPFWEGSSLIGKVILLYGEQGLGDALQFLRYAPLVKAGATVVVACPRPLESLVKTCSGVDEVLVEGSPVPANVEIQALLPSLPGIFRTTLETIPAKIPYVFADPALVESWRVELGEVTSLKVGIAWQGSAANRRDRWRSVPLPQFTPLSRLQGVRLFSLQVGPGCEQIKELGDRFAITDLASRFDPSSFVDAAAVMMNLDLVITVDTATAHLAGALGVPVWITLPFAPDWRWLLDREDSPWYPTMRLFRQRRRGDWGEVFERMAGQLLARSAAPTWASRPP